MIEQVLETLCVAIEGANLSWGAWALNGSSEAKRCTIFPADPDQTRGENLMVGLDYLTNFGSVSAFDTFGDEQSTGSSNVRNLDVVTGRFDYEPPLQYITRSINVHLYMRETRRDEDRVGFDLATTYARNESRLMNAIGTKRRQWNAPVPVPNTTPQQFVPRGFRTALESNFFVPEDGLTIHGVLSWRVRYPLVTGVELQPGFVAKRIHIGVGISPNVLPGIPTQSVSPLVLPAGATELIV